jgi:APA family basic amino acid/polyamine antiporter
VARTEVLPASHKALQRNAGPFLAICLIIANVIGSGIYTTPGFLARDLRTPFAVLAVWIIGAVLAFAGALSYCELGAMFPEAGGEYVYLREAFGPLFGFLTGWASFVAGFSAPIGAATIGFAAYLSHFLPGLSPENILWKSSFGRFSLHISAGQIVALAVLWMLSLSHISGVRRGGQLQVLLTAIKVAAIVSLIVLGLLLGKGDWGNLYSSAPGILPAGVFSNGAVSLVFVLFSFSGWNAAAYIAGEIREPRKTLPLALIGGTAAVTVIYLGLNVVFLYALGIQGMSGVLQVGEKASLVLFGPAATHVVAAMMAGSILASASAMIIAGPRVYFAMAKDGLFFKSAGTIHPAYRSPSASILWQAAWVSVLILSSAFEPLIVYSGFVLVLFSSMAVAAVVVLRARFPERPRPFRVPFYPWTPLIFIVFSLWILTYTLQARPVESASGVATVLAGLPLYFYWSRKRDNSVPDA